MKEFAMFGLSSYQGCWGAIDLALCQLAHYVLNGLEGRQIRIYSKLAGSGIYFIFIKSFISSWTQEVAHVAN